MRNLTRNEPLFATSKTKVFVGRLSTDLSRADLMDYFSQFGTITDITIPQPFRSFAFITFQESSDAISILDQDHLIKGVSVVTRSADPIQGDFYICLFYSKFNSKIKNRECNRPKLTYAMPKRRHHRHQSSPRSSPCPLPCHRQ